MSFTVTVQPSGIRFTAARGETLLSAALRQGVALPHGCRDGACGSCKCRVVEGQVAGVAAPDRLVSAHDKAQGVVLSCGATADSDLVLHATLLPDGASSPRKLPARVMRAERRGADVMLIELQLPPVEGWRHAAGQYIDIVLRDGSRRSYSIANAPAVKDAPAAAQTIELHVRHLPGGKFTDHVFGTMRPQELLRIEGPLGGFFLREERCKPLILLASGTGLAPLKAIVEHMRAQGIRRFTTLYWGCRRASDLYLREWITAVQRDMPELRCVMVLSEPDESDAWTGRTGLVHEVVMADWPDLRGHEVYACGAPPMVTSAQRDFVARCGLPPEAFFADAFLSERDRLPTAPVADVDVIADIDLTV